MSAPALLAIFSALSLTAAAFFLPGVFGASYEREGASATLSESRESRDTLDTENSSATSTDGAVLSEYSENAYHPEESVNAIYLPTPEPLKAIYMSQCVAGTPSFRSDLVELIEETELNAVVIDIKDYTGKIAFPTNHPLLVNSVSDQCGARDMASFIRDLNMRGIYVIGRITVFQDPYYTNAYPEYAVKKMSNTQENWQDHKGLSFVDVSAKPFWEYIVALSEESHRIGFDELNYDYIRFPSDGPMRDIYYPHSKDMPKREALERFFAYLARELKPLNTTLSADLFGMVTTNTDDLNIGQQLERALPYFDYIAPMVYPSHYPNGFNGYGNLNHYPHEVVEYSMTRAAARTEASRSAVETLSSEPIYTTKTVVDEFGATTTEEVFSGLYSKEVYSKLKLRPWLQDFNYGGTYGPEEVRTQIEATYDSGLTSWMLWAPSNRYTREALEPFYKPKTLENESHPLE